MMSTVLEPNLQWMDMLESLTIGLICLNSKGLVEYVNPQAKSWLQCEPGQPWASISTKLTNPNEPILPAGQSLSVETSPLSQGGQIIAMMAIQHRGQNDHTQRLQQLGNMCANLAHQIRNPLFSALLKVDQLQGLHPDEPKLISLKSCLKGIEQEINSILMFSRSDEKIIERIDIEQVLSKAIEQVDIEKKSIMIDFDVRTYSNAQVIANPQALIGVFANLVTNAIDASESKQLVRIQVIETDHLNILIEDQGQGIPSALLGKVFDPFYTTKTHGTGLGLSIAKQVIESHGGLITLSSIEGQGTQINVQLPKG